jgi:thymidylate synthase ThyX
MTIEAKIIADSVSPYGPRITTFQLKYPRFIHAEFMTHRMFSRNASSSRAIPVEKQIDMIREDTAMPSHWGKNQSGMQAELESSDSVTIPETICTTEGKEIFPKEYTNEAAWCEARDRAIEVARGFVKAGYHKQIVNRILEPFSHISVVCTATNYENFFWLRRHKDAQPEIKILADKMFDVMTNSMPVKLSEYDWHLPYITDDERDGIEVVNLGDGNIGEQAHFTTDELIKMSVARCARVSYLTHDGETPDYKKDLALYERLVGSSPLHASPAEHQAKPDGLIFVGEGLKDWENRHLHGNFTGFQQFRKMLPGEAVSDWAGLNSFD